MFEFQERVRVVEVTEIKVGFEGMAASFDIFRAFSSSANFILVASTSTTAYEDFLFQSGTYYYQVAGVDSNGVAGPPSNIVSVLLDVAGPNAVTDLRVYAVNSASSQITLAWTAPSDDVTSVAAYQLEESSNPINSLNFNAVPNLAAGLLPLPAGSTQTLVVSVSTNAANYFLLESSDAADRT